MEMSPQRVRSAEFKTARKGADPDEVRLFLNDVADELERAQNQSAAMEARARAAVARLQELTDAAPTVAPTAPPATSTAVDASVEEAETISRTLLLAQRTADTTIADARAEAARLVGAANDEAATTLDSTREMVAQLLEEARADARQAGETERLAVSSAVEALKARRDFLESDVEQLELFLTEQRNRLREAATSLLDITERVPGGLGQARPPLLSASDDEPTVASGPEVVAEADTAGEDSAADDIAEEDTASTVGEGPVDATESVVDGLWSVGERAETVRVEPAAGFDPWGDSGEPTAAMPVVPMTGTTGTTDESGGFRFSFDDDRR